MLVLNPSRKNIFEKGKILWKFSEILRKRINWRRDLKRILTDTWKFIFQTTLLPLKIKIEINEKMSQIGIILIELEFVVIGQLGGSSVELTPGGKIVGWVPCVELDVGTIGRGVEFVWRVVARVVVRVVTGVVARVVARVVVRRVVNLKISASPVILL